VALCNHTGLRVKYEKCCQKRWGMYFRLASCHEGKIFGQYDPHYTVLLYDINFIVFQTFYYSVFYLMLIAVDLFQCTRQPAS